MRVWRPTGTRLLARLAFSGLTVSLGLSLSWQAAFARTHHYAVSRHIWHRPAHHAAMARAANWGSPTDPGKDAELMIDGRTGRVLYARNAEAQRHPASMTK